MLDSIPNPTETTAAALACLALAGVGASVPAMADGILRRSRERYRAWLHEALDAYRTFWRTEGRAPSKRRFGRERALSEWAAELPRLAADGMLSQHELRLVAAAGVPVPLRVTDDMLARAPSESEVERTFSLMPTPALTAAGGVLVGACAAVFHAAWGPSFAATAGALFAAACWLMAVVDARSRTIPGVCTLLIAATGVAWHAAADVGALATSAAMAACAWLLLLCSNRASRAIRGEDGIGGGDVRTLPAVIGVLGPYGTPAGLTAAALALVAYLAAKACAGKLSLREKIPFGPFIAIAGIGGALYLSLG